MRQSPGRWTAEGDGIEGTWVGTWAELEDLIPGLIDRGIEVTVPPIPPVV